MKNTLRRLVLAATLVAGACSSPVGVKERQIDPGTPMLDAASPDSNAARGGGNLMGGN
jgi:hypothetical protein